MGALLSSLFDTTGFPARWHCGNWTAFHGWLHILSDVAIFGAYMGIPLALMVFIRKRSDLPRPLPAILWLFGVFIVACGLTHLTDAIIFWKPIYRLAGVIKAVTAAVSWTTLAFLVPAIPKALALKSPDQLRQQVAEATAQLRCERDAAAYLAGIVESSHDAIISQDMHGLVQSWNPGAARMFGFSLEEIVGKAAAILVPDERRAELLDALRRVHQQRFVDQLETERVRKDGSRVSVSLTISPFFDHRGELCGLSMIFRDVSATRKAEALFRAAVDASPSGMLAVDRRGQIVLVNAEAERLFGYGSEELLGKPIELLVPQEQRAAHPALRNAYAEAPKARWMGTGRALSGVRKDASTFPIEVGLNPIEVHGESLILSAIVDRSELTREQNALRAKTEELQRSNDELEQFAFVASHDLQEPLRMVVNFMGLLRRDYTGALDATAIKYVDFAVDGADRMKQLVDDLLRYSRIGSCGGHFESLMLEDVMSNVAKSLTLLIEESGAQIVCDALPTIHGDSRQIEQVFQNLMSNAIKFRRGPSPVIHVGCTERAEEWEVTVQDDGIGFDVRHADRIFQMFQRLHARSNYAGSGMGLAIAKRIVTRHGGQIWATSTLGEGATFHFTLPRRAVSPGVADV